MRSEGRLNFGGQCGAVRCCKSRILLVLACSTLLLGGLFVHSYEPMHVWRSAYSTNQYGNVRLHAPSTQAPCDATCAWFREQEVRKERVSAVCESYRNASMLEKMRYTMTPEVLKQMNHMMVLDSHQLIYCYIPKVGCTSWKRIFLVLSGAIKSTNKISQFQTHVRAEKLVRSLDQYSLDEAIERLANYTKFMFVRHPFERLISVYRDKFLMDYPASTTFRKKYGEKIASYKDPGLPKLTQRPDGTLNVSFRQFSRYVGDPDNVFVGNDPTEHWNEMYRMCFPCLVDYDILGNFSTLHEDADFLLHHKGLDSKVLYPKSTNPTNSSDMTYMNSYFQDVSQSDIEALLTRYAIDFDLFGYTIPTSIQRKLNNVEDNV